MTPHIAWARPYAAGPVKALFLIHRQNQREVIELAQRLQLDYTVFCAEDPGKFGETGEGVDAGWRLVQGNSAEELAAQLRTDLQADYDVFIVGNVKWDSFPLDCRYEILKKVKAGTGLVGYMPNGHDEHLDRLLENADFRWAYANWSGEAQGVPDFFGIGDFVGAVDTADPHAGECAVRITGREVKMGSREPPRGGYYLHPVKVEPNTQYRFSAWYKAADGGQPSISLHPTSAGVPTPAGEGWQHTEVTWNTGDKTEFGIYLLSVAVGKVWYDDLSLVKVGDDRNLLPNPGFENPGPAPDLLTEGIPYPALPAFSGFSTPGDFARGVFRIAQFGQGRVALLQGFSVPITQAMTPAPQGPMRTAQLDYDYYLAAAIKAILWAAHKEPPVAILTPEPKLTIAHADLGAGRPTFRLSGPDAE